MVERIQEIMNNKNLTPSLFADEIGVKRSSISHILSGRNKASLEIVQKIISRFNDIDTNWLIFGTTNTNKTSANIVNQNKLFENKSIEAINNEKVIEKIVVFYSDNTFHSYNPD